MPQKFLTVVSGNFKEVEGLVTSAGAGDAGKLPALDSAGKLDTSVMPTGIGADTKAIVASENLAAGDLVNVWNDTGTIKVRKADATSPSKRAHGFVLSSVSSAANATVYFEGTITGLSSLTLGATYFLGTTAGAATATATTTAGHIVQQVGVAVSATELSFEPQQPVELA